MKKRLSIWVLIFIVLIACREKEGKPDIENREQEIQEQEVSTADPPAIISLKPAYEEEVKSWEAFTNLEIEMQKFQKAAKNNDVLTTEDLLNLEKQLSESEFPEKFNIPAIKSRIIVFKTYLLQTRSMVNNQEPGKEALHTQKIKIITAFNAVKKQLAQTLTDDATEQLLKDIEEQLKDTVQ